jgi:RHS repeat-associated protein
LPVSAGILSYTPISNAKSLAQSFYADAAPTDSSIFESSPLNRTKATFGVGKAWRVADKKTQLFYEAGGNEVRNYSVNSSGNIVLSGTYPANSLFKKRMLDEQGHESIEYTDKRGRMIEKRQQLETGVYAHTHYIYDGLGRPKAIIQPMGYELNTGFSYNSTNFQNWVFFYNYDFRGRNDLKHVPAAGFTKMVYDKKDRLVMQQDALQATLNKWNFEKYDAFDREVFRGETFNSNSQTVLQTAFNSHAAPDEVWSSGSGYNGGSFPANANPSGNDVQHYTFYDQYDFVSALNTNFNFDAGNSYHTKHSSAKSLQTGSVSYNLADHNQYFMSASYFDTKNRPIQSFETHVLSPTLPNKADVEYNFSGEVLKKRTLHKQVGKPEITELYENEYDHVGRPIKIFHTLNGIKSEISRFTYDPIGRQISKKIKPGFTYKSGLSDIIIRSSEPPINTQDYVRRNIQLLPGFVYCPDSLAPSLYLGQVDTLGLGGTTDALQTIDYSYNIRNGLRCINCTNDLLTNLNQTQNDLFGMKLDFHETGTLFDGNIHKQSWIKANDNVQRTFTYGYDFSKRLKSATFGSANNEDFSLPNMSYDKNGNILALARKGKIGSNFNLLDDLSYSYLGNKLLKVEDAVSDTTKNYFNNRNIISNDFEYDTNGNLKKDLNENINQINYNSYQNQPIEVIKVDGSWEKSFYDGSGHLFKRTNSIGTTWTYSGNIIYKNDTLYQIGTPEGRIIQDTLGNFHYQFEYRDLTGNLRLLYQDPTTGNPSVRMAPEIVQSQDYEPFGVGFNEYFGNRNKNRLGYSNHELVDDLGLNRIDFGNRTYNPTYGRFDKSDIFSDIFESFSPYTFVYNSPLINIDMYGDSTVPVNNLDWMKFNVNNDEILLNAVTITGTTDVGKKVAPALGFWEGMWEGMRKSSDGRIINRDGTQSAMFAPITGTIPDVGIGRVGTIYTAVKKGLPYIGKTFNILKRYSKSERLTLQVEQQIKNIAGNNKLIRAIEQKALEYKRSIGEVANKRNAFNPKNKDYQEYMQKAETWLSKNLPEWKKLID